MSYPVDIRDYPIFEKGVFKTHPELFEPYFRNTPDHVKKKYDRARKSLPKYEGTFTWQTISGPGFRGAVHPGAGKIFNEVMTGSSHPVYASDCIYVNLCQQVFAISDPPGATSLSRSLLTQLDRYLTERPALSLEEAVNNVNKEAGTGLKERATLSLVHIPPVASGTGLTKSVVMLAGDSHLLHGNRITGSIKRIEAYSSRWGTPNVDFQTRSIELDEGDFFIMTSDGISSIRASQTDMNIEELLVHSIINNWDGFAFDVIQRCNSLIEERNSNQVKIRFNGSDDISILAVIPSSLNTNVGPEKHILGGYVV
ncbi:MAG: SpoIIE family protein phosphatase [Dehalococcoidia bacterium]